MLQEFNMHQLLAEALWKWFWMGVL